MTDFDDAGGWPGVLGRLTTRSDLTVGEASDVLGRILAGEASDAQIAALVIGLRTKGETAAEVAGLVDAMLAAASPLDLPDPAATLDIVGTGGSTALAGGAFNVSTMASFVAAAAGATVCKHGNRKASSTSGSTDLLESLGAEAELDGAGVVACIREAGVGFAFARMFHPAMRHVAAVRSELGVRTVFNILGPLSHPGRVGRQVVGVPDPHLVDLVAATIARRGTVHTWVVHGHDGLDELTTTAASTVVEIRGDEQRRFEVAPEDVHIPRAELEDITVGDPAANAAAATSVMDGETGALRDMVVLNAAAGLVVAGLAAELPEGVALASRSIDSGAAARTLGKYVAASRAYVAAQRG